MAPPRRLLPVLLPALAALSLAGCRSEDAVRVAAASDLAVAFDGLLPDFERVVGRKVLINYGSTGQLARQIAEGAPFDLFAAASLDALAPLAAAGDCDGHTRAVFARGRLVIVAREGGALPTALGDLANPAFQRIALANPEHAPYGRAAEQALASAGLLPALRPRLVQADNVRQSLQFVRSGNADVGFVALALVAGQPALRVDESAYGPLDQALVVCRHGRNEPGGRALAAFLLSEPVQRALAGHGLGRAAR